jgi:hypothetical protein
MKNKKQTVFVQMLAFFTAALSVVFLRQYTLGKFQQKNLHADGSTVTLPASPKILLETAEVALSEEIIVKPIEI